MMEYLVGDYVISTMGRDVSRIYVIIEVSSEYLYLVDGKQRLLSNPKRKNSKHVAYIGHVEDKLLMKINNASISNEEIKRTIKICKQGLTRR